MPPPMVGVPPPMYGAQTTTYTQQAYAPPPVTYSQTTMVQPGMRSLLALFWPHSCDGLIAVGMYPHQAPYGAPPPPYY